MSREPRSLSPDNCAKVSAPYQVTTSGYVMNGGGPGLLKFECVVATNRSATRLPISWGELPAGHFLNSFGCSSSCKGNASTTIHVASNNTNALRYRFIMSPLVLG